MFYYKIYEQGSDKLLAVCDEDILGQTFSGGGFEITVSEFYEGETCTERDILEKAKKSTIINAIGNRVVALLIKNGLVEKGAVLEIGGTLHAQVVSVD